MSEQPDNPPAFPCGLLEDAVMVGMKHKVFYPGMTLRDYFAGEALTGILLAPGQYGQEAQASTAKAAQWAYSQADAMLVAREAKHPTP